MRAAWLAVPLLVAACAPPHEKGQASSVHDEVVRALKEGSYAEGATVAWPDGAAAVLRTHQDYVRSLSEDSSAGLVAHGYALSYILLCTGDPKRQPGPNEYEVEEEIEQLLCVFTVLRGTDEALQLKMLLADWIPRVCLRWQSAGGLARYIEKVMGGAEYGGSQTSALAWLLNADPKLFVSALVDALGYEGGRDDVLESSSSLLSLKNESDQEGAYRQDLDRALEAVDSLQFDNPRHKRAWMRFLQWLSTPLDE